MAEQLVTQVRNPKDHDFTPHTPVLATDEEEEDQNEKDEHHPVAENNNKCTCWSFFCCLKNRKVQQKADVQRNAPSYANNQQDQQPPQAPQQPLPTQQDESPQPDDYPIAPPPKTAIKHLLPALPAEDKNKKTLVLDLDETLVHSSFKPIPNADFVISIELESVIHRVYVLKRPGVDNFLRVVGQKFEVVVFTASLAKYADPLLDILDRSKVIKARLFRESCVHHYGNYVKDLSHLGRRLEHTMIIDNSPFCYMFQPDNAIPITSWFNDKNDRQLYDLLPFLDSILNVDDVCTVLQRRKPQLLPANGEMHNN